MFWETALIWLIEPLRWIFWIYVLYRFAVASLLKRLEKSLKNVADSVI